MHLLGFDTAFTLSHGNKQCTLLQMECTGNRFPKMPKEPVVLHH